MADKGLTCPVCRNNFDAATIIPGATVKCPGCGAPITVPTAADLIGRTIAGYRVIEKIGEGGMAIVYLAEQVSLKRNVAFKVLKKPTHTADFHHEAVAAARITHPNIVSVFDIAQAQGITFIAMEYVDGVSLRKLLRRGGVVPIPRALAIVRQVLAALVRAHRDGLIHRDIKPENILADRDGLLKVADFGLAEFFEGGPGAARGAAEVEARLRQRGTPCYVSPEQARGQPCDARTDIYSTGVVLYEMLAGAPPYVGGSAREVVFKLLKEPVPALSEINPGIPQALSNLVSRMMAKLPADRPGSAENVLRQINGIEERTALTESGAFSSAEWQRAYLRALAGAEAAEQSPVAKRVRVSGWPAIVAVVVALLALVVAGYAYRRLGKPGQPPAPPPPKPPPLSEPTAQEQAEQRAKVLYFAAAAYAGEHPEEYAAIVSRFEKVASTDPGTKYGRHAKWDAACARRQWLAAGKKVVGEMTDTVNRLAKEGRFSEALAACKLPQAFKGTGLENEVESLRAGVNTRAKQRIGELLSDFRSHLTASEFDAAQHCVDALRQIGLRDAERAAQRLGQNLRQRKKDVEEEWAYDAKVDHYLLLQEADRLAALRQYDRAVEFLNERIESPRYAAISAPLEKERNGILLAQQVHDKAIAHLIEKPGMEVRVRGILGQFVEIRDGIITVQSEVGLLSDSISKFSYKEISRLARSALADRGEATAQLAVGVFLLHDRHYPEAGREFKRASSGGQNTAYYLWRLKIASQDKWADARKPALAQRALYRMRKARKHADWREVIRQVRELRSLWAVPVVLENRAEINAAVAEAVRKLRGARP